MSARRIATSAKRLLKLPLPAANPTTTSLSQKSRVRIIAAYLPQFHPIPENDEWWGKGFTEWTNVAKAKPLFKGHYQPRVPADLGYYDLRLPESRQAQADLAKEYGVEGFCYWHYWFGGGRRLLERPFDEVLNSGKPDFPFCLAWANHSWKDKLFRLNGAERLLIEQQYPGKADYVLHFNTLLPAFKDRRYIQVDDKPLFYVFAPGLIPDVFEFIQLWKSLALDNGLSGMHFVGQTHDVQKIGYYLSKGFDAVNIIRLFDFVDKHSSVRSASERTKRSRSKRGEIADYRQVHKYFHGDEDHWETVYPCVFPNWDPSPRTGRKGHILVNSTPSAFKKHVRHVIQTVKNKSPEHQIVFLKSWNEWAEGSYIEPDLKYGRGYLESLKEALIETRSAFELTVS